MKRLKIPGFSVASCNDVIFHNNLQVRSPLMTLILGRIKRRAILCIALILFQAMEIVFVIFLSDVVNFPCLPFNLRAGVMLNLLQAVVLAHARKSGITIRVGKVMQSP